VRLEEDVTRLLLRSEPPPAPPGCAWIPLPRGTFALIDAGDAPRVAPFVWFLGTRGVRTAGGRVKLARFLLDAPAGRVVDHINGDILDNRRANLRLCTQAGNGKNRHNRRDNKTGYKGVSLRRNGRWIARIRSDDVLHHLGSFTDVEEAARAYDAAARRLHGEFARLNFLAG
jgi:hypothetical protein